MQKSSRIIGLAGYYDFIRNLNSLLFYINPYAFLSLAIVDSIVLPYHSTG